MADATELPEHASRLTVPQTGSGIFQVAAVVHAVALDCCLQGVYQPQAQVALSSHHLLLVLLPCSATDRF